MLFYILNIFFLSLFTVVTIHTKICYRLHFINTLHKHTLAFLRRWRPLKTAD